MDKEKNLSDALWLLNKDYLINASIIEPIKCGTVEVLYASASGVFVKDNSSDVYMLETKDLALADKLLDDFPHGSALVVHNDALCDFAEERFKFKSNVPCYQAVYRKERFPDENTDVSLRLIREDEAHEAANMYRFTLDDAKKHIRKGLVYGCYLGDTVIGMIGMHLQGSMGMLEVKKEFRHRGYAAIMEKFLINSLLSKGLVPYCQIIEDNVASLSLQSKLGLDVSKNKLYWLHE